MAVSVFWVGVMTVSRRWRALTGAVSACSETFAVFPRTWVTVVQVVPSFDTWRSKSRVLNAALSPPAPAWRTVSDRSVCAVPRSTRRNLVAASEQNLSELPPETLPLTALAGASLALHGAEPVAALFRARFVGPVPPPVSNDGGASAAALPHAVLGVAPSVYPSVPPLLTNDSGSHGFVDA